MKGIPGVLGHDVVKEERVLDSSVCNIFFSVDERRCDVVPQHEEIL